MPCMARTEHAPLVYRALVVVVRMIAPLLTKRRWLGGEHVPERGGAIVVANHIGNYDVITLGDYLIANGRYPRYLGKAEIWKVPVLGWLARQARQIPVERHTARAKDSLQHARAALEAGDLVAIYPEGTITKDPDGWPMRARTGAARLALATGVPVVPVGQIGAEHVLGGHQLQFRKLFSLRRRPVTVMAGPPVDLTDMGIVEDPTDEQLREATARIMSDVTDLVAELRGEPVPELVWDPWLKQHVGR